MSDLKAKMSGVRFEPVPDRPPVPGEGSLIIGVIYPALVIAMELAWHWCAQSFFDPIPTWGHVVAVALVPAGNLLVWLHLRNGAPANDRWVAVANGVSLAIAAFYALLFLPLAPLALIGILVAVGILPLAPLAAFASAVRLRRLFRRKHKDEPSGWHLMAGVAAGLVLLLAVDLPSAATRLGMQWATSGVPAERERGVALLRNLGDEDLLLRLCYGDAGRPVGLSSAFAMYEGVSLFRPQPQQLHLSPIEAREIYYRVYGVPFNAKPPPAQTAQSGARGILQDRDHGGTQVGGRVAGLKLASSRLDGSVSGDDAVAYLEWTFEVHNAEPFDREARLQLALPPGGVVSRATLWVNGEEREAAYGGRAEVRAAYQRVAVQQRRDPLLVTTKGADRVLAQAFPVPRNGGSIKFKIGITAPLELVSAASGRLALPAILERNFALDDDQSHAVWIEGKSAMSAPGLTGQPAGERTFRLTGALDDRTLSEQRQVIAVERDPLAVRRSARIAEGETVRQDIVPGSPGKTLVVVLDGSARLGDASTTIAKAFDALPADMKVGLVVASEPLRQVAPAAWSADQKNAVQTLIRRTSFVGGQDNAPALIEALRIAESEPDTTLLWIHGPQPVGFRASSAQLEQASARISRFPKVVLYEVAAGPNEVLPDTGWAWEAVSLPRKAGPAPDLAEFFARLSRPTPVLQRSHAEATDEPTTGSEHIARLWARGRVLDLMRKPVANRSTAAALATRYRLVTPVSGAVVLENQRQYDESRLTPVSQATVPTIPEPHEWLLIAIACAALTWLAWSRRASNPVPA